MGSAAVGIGITIVIGLIVASICSSSETFTCESPEIADACRDRMTAVGFAAAICNVVGDEVKFTGSSKLSSNRGDLEMKCPGLNLKWSVHEDDEFVEDWEPQNAQTRLFVNLLPRYAEWRMGPTEARSKLLLVGESD